MSALCYHIKNWGIRNAEGREGVEVENSHVGWTGCATVKGMGMAFRKKKSAFSIYFRQFSPFSPYENYPKNRARSLFIHCSSLISWKES